jgi:hypothetical protein
MPNSVLCAYFKLMYFMHVCNDPVATTATCRGVAFAHVAAAVLCTAKMWLELLFLYPDGGLRIERQGHNLSSSVRFIDKKAVQATYLMCQ